jgi:hypothetical protein
MLIRVHPPSKLGSNLAETHELAAIFGLKQTQQSEARVGADGGRKLQPRAMTVTGDIVFYKSRVARTGAGASGALPRHGRCDSRHDRHRRLPCNSEHLT